MKTKEEREAIREELERIAGKNGGLLTPDDVVASARQKNSILHGMFEWDEKKAAHAYRVDQARVLIRSVTVVITTEKTNVSTVAYVRDPDIEADEQGYVSTVSLIGDTERCRAALVAEFSRAAAALRRARELAVAFGMDGEVTAVADSIDTMRTRITASVEQRAAA